MADQEVDHFESGSYPGLLFDVIIGNIYKTNCNKVFYIINIAAYYKK